MRCLWMHSFPQPPPELGHPMNESRLLLPLASARRRLGWGPVLGGLHCDMGGGGVSPAKGHILLLSHANTGWSQKGATMFAKCMVKAGSISDLSSRVLAPVGAAGRWGDDLKDVSGRWDRCAEGSSHLACRAAVVDVSGGRARATPGCSRRLGGEGEGVGTRPWWLALERGGGGRDALEGWQVPRASRGPSPCPATVSLTASAGLSGIGNRQSRQDLQIKRPLKAAFVHKI